MIGSTAGKPSSLPALCDWVDELGPSVGQATERSIMKMDFMITDWEEKLIFTFKYSLVRI